MLRRSSWRSRRPCRRSDTVALEAFRSTCASVLGEFQRPRRGICRYDPAENFLFRAELLLSALGHDQNVVDAGDRTRAMRDDHRDCAACAQPENCAGQSLVAFGIKIRIGLVEHDQEWIAIERA